MHSLRGTSANTLVPVLEPAHISQLTHASTDGFAWAWDGQNTEDYMPLTAWIDTWFADDELPEYSPAEYRPYRSIIDRAWDCIKAILILVMGIALVYLFMIIPFMWH